MNNTNPIDSIAAWMNGVGHGAAQQMLYEALCTEEQAEAFDEFETRFKGSVQKHNDHHDLAATMHRLAKTMRADLSIEVTNPINLLDAHLDSAWVHLCAAMAMLGGGEQGLDKLREAWGRLHKGNVTDKQVDGRYMLDASGKVQKPAGWTAPEYGDLLDHVAADSEGGEV